MGYQVAAARACHKEFLDSGSNDDQFSSFYAKDCERLGTHNLRQVPELHASMRAERLAGCVRPFAPSLARSF